MENVAAGYKGTKRTTHGPHTGTLRSAARTDMWGLALFCAVIPTERRMVLDQFPKTLPVGSEEPDRALETVAVPIVVDAGE